MLSSYLAPIGAIGDKPTWQTEDPCKGKDGRKCIQLIPLGDPIYKQLVDELYQLLPLAQPPFIPAITKTTRTDEETNNPFQKRTP